MVAIGSSAGVSAAFGAPIGGALFAYEISKPNTIWKFSVLWKTFIASAISVFFLAFFQQIFKGLPPTAINSAVLKFGLQDVEQPTFSSIFAAIILGIVCGLMGACFVAANLKINIFRRSFLTSKAQRIIEAVIFAFVTSSCFFWMPNSTRLYCENVEDVDE